MESKTALISLCMKVLKLARSFYFKELVILVSPDDVRIHGSPASIEKLLPLIRLGDLSAWLTHRFWANLTIFSMTGV
jgi:hypothetical protein